MRINGSDDVLYMTVHDIDDDDDDDGGGGCGFSYNVDDLTFEFNDEGVWNVIHYLYYNA